MQIKGYQSQTKVLLNFLGSLFLIAGPLACSHSPDSDKPATREELKSEVSLKKDREDLAELRKNIPDEIKKSNDRLAEVLTRWKQHKTPPDELREKFDDEIRKMRAEFEKRVTRRREDFNKHIAAKRKDFQEKQKETREDFLSEKPKSEKRSAFMDRQSEDRDRFNSDLRDERDEFEDLVKEERKNFESDVANRRTEFRQEFPEYQRVYKEMKAAEEKANEESKSNPKPYGGWPYKEEKVPGTFKGVAPEQVDVNKGGNGWPASDPAELNQVPNPSKSGN